MESIDRIENLVIIYLRESEALFIYLKECQDRTLQKGSIDFHQQLISIVQLRDQARDRLYDLQRTKIISTSATISLYLSSLKTSLYSFLKLKLIFFFIRFIRVLSIFEKFIINFRQQLASPKNDYTSLIFQSSSYFSIALTLFESGASLFFNIKQSRNTISFL